MRTILLVLFLCSLPCLAVAGTTSYHIGASLLWDSQPEGVKAIAEQNGIDHDVGYHINCATPLHLIIADPEETCITPVPEYGTYTLALANNAWDAVTMQTVRSVPLGSTLGTDMASVLELIDIAQTNPANADTTFYIFQSWPRYINWDRDWLKSIVNDPSSYTDYAKEYYIHLIEGVRSATEAKINMIPVAEVLYELDMRMEAGEIPGYTDISQFYRNEPHLSWSLGRYTAGITMYATLFGQDPAGLTKPAAFYNPASDFTPALYAAIHSAVWDVVSTHPYAGSIIPAGDFDFDGDVDGADFLLWQQGGSPDPFSSSDLADWEANYSAPLSATSAAVPEASSLLLGVMTSIGLMLRRRCLRR